MGLGFEDVYHKKVFPGGASSKEATCQCRRQETRVSFLGWEDPLEDGMATGFSILARRILWLVTVLLLLLLLSHFSRVRLCATPETAAHQVPPSLGFSRQEHWSRSPFPSPMYESER